jgi:hypothetical protein
MNNAESPGGMTDFSLATLNAKAELVLLQLVDVISEMSELMKRSAEDA